MFSEVETPTGPGPEVCHVAVPRHSFTNQYLQLEAAGPATRLWLCSEASAGYAETANRQMDRYEESQSADWLAPEPPASVPDTTAGGNLTLEVPFKQLIASAASQFQIDPDFVTSVVKAESGFIATATSPKGAQGLMQLMPQTAAMLGVTNVLDPVSNLEGGTRYLRQLLDRYDGDAVKALAAYNAGPQRVEEFGGVPPYRETYAYVTRIIQDYNRKKLRESAAAAPAGK
jgi:soluble lytic murein transglycosylase-like protein